MISPDKTIINQLITFGLSEKEAIVYLTMIECGVLSAQQIAKNSGLNRSSTYMILESLMIKDLISISKNGNGVSVYEAFGPDLLLKKATEMEQNQKEIHKNIDAIIPDLIALSPALAMHPRVKFYEGGGGIETVRHDLLTLNATKMIRTFSVNPASYVKTNHPTHIISPYKNKMDSILSSKSFSIRFVPGKQYDFSSDICIYANKIVLISEREEFAAIIEDAYFARIMKETFDLAWEEAGRLDAQLKISKTTRRNL